MLIYPKINLEDEFHWKPGMYEKLSNQISKLNNTKTKIRKVMDGINSIWYTAEESINELKSKSVENIQIKAQKIKDGILKEH